MTRFAGQTQVWRERILDLVASDNHESLMFFSGLKQGTFPDNHSKSTGIEIRLQCISYVIGNP